MTICVECVRLPALLYDWIFAHLQPSFVVSATATDTVTSLAASRAFTVSLSHVNRPPAWLTVPTLFAPALTSGTIGSPLLQYVTDPDIALNIGESETFAITAGNTGGTFAIAPLSGQIYVANNNTPAFQFQRPPFNLTISVTDAGIDGAAFTASTVVTIQVRGIGEGALGGIL